MIEAPGGERTLFNVNTPEDVERLKAEG